VTSALNSAVNVLRIRHFLREDCGLAAIEFAIVLPVMLIALLGAVDIEDGIAVSIKNTITARTITDLVTQYQSIRPADLTTILNASTQVIAPYSAAHLTVTVSEVQIDATGNATIAWSQSFNGTARTVGSAVALPAGVGTPNTYLIWGEASYTYNPTVGYVLTNLITLSNQIFMSPRKSSNVILCSPTDQQCATA
jgi:Flp pilus assembly protein TadG